MKIYEQTWKKYFENLVYFVCNYDIVILHCILLSEVHMKIINEPCCGSTSGDIQTTSRQPTSTVSTVSTGNHIGGAIRNDDGKLPLDLIPTSAIRGIAEVLQFGARKYEPRNWERGMAWSRVSASLQRHLLDYLDGIDRDPESGLHQMAHILCNAAFLLEYSKTHPELDDRIKKNMSLEQLLRPITEKELEQAERINKRIKQSLLKPSPLTEEEIEQAERLNRTIRQSLKSRNDNYSNGRT